MEFFNDCLQAHNKLRERHGASPLSIELELCDRSQKLANYLVKKFNYGENTYCINSKDENFILRGDEPVKAWYTDIKKHNFFEEPSILTSGRFTQIVWKSTKEIGVGIAQKRGKTVIVANYFPPGNISGQFVENVLKVPDDTIHNIEAEMSKMMEALKTNEKNYTVNNFVDDFLKAHNELRKRHEVPSLKLDPKLCKHSQLLADYLIDKEEYGENTYCISSTDPNRVITGDEPVKSWYNEIERHNFSSEPNQLRAGSFTQLVWKQTRQLGIGMAKYENKTVVVANYYPSGNIMGEFLNNVAPPKGGSTVIKSESKASIHGTEGDFELDFLKVHNEYRIRHGVPDLILNEDLCKYSQDWAEYLASKDIMQPSDNCPYGENIYSVGSSNPDFAITGRVPVDFWYDEVRHLPDSDRSQTENFSQVISNASHNLGVGVAKSAGGYIYVVANYSSDHNIEEHSPEKMLKIRKEAMKKATEEFDDVALRGLEVHNKYRALHGAPTMLLSHDLCKYAKKWANFLAETNSLIYPANAQCEVNICEHREASDTDPVETSIKTWYNKSWQHNFKNPQTGSSDTDEFIKMVWKGNEEFGMAEAKNQFGYIYIVACYTPRRSYIKEQILANVLPPIRA